MPDTTTESDDSDGSADRDQPPTEAPEGPPEGASEEPGSQGPTIDDQDRVDVDVSDIADEIEADTGASEAPESGDGGDVDDSDEGAPEGASGPTSTSWGDIYVDGLAVVLVAVVDELEEGAADLSTEDVTELAMSPPVNLAEQADRVAEQMGSASQLPPEQALLLSTIVVVGAVVLTKTDLASQGIGELFDQMDDDSLPEPGSDGGR